MKSMAATTSMTGGNIQQFVCWDVMCGAKGNKTSLIQCSNTLQFLHCVYAMRTCSLFHLRTCNIRSSPVDWNFHLLCGFPSHTVQFLCQNSIKQYQNQTRTENFLHDQRRTAEMTSLAIQAYHALAVCLHSSRTDSRPWQHHIELHVRAAINKFYKVNILKRNKSQVTHKIIIQNIFYGRRASFINFYVVLDESRFSCEFYSLAVPFRLSFCGRFAACSFSEEETTFYQINSHNKNIYHFFLDSITLHECVCGRSFHAKFEMAHSVKCATSYHKKICLECRRYAKWLNCFIRTTLTGWLGENLLNYYVNGT